MKSCNDYVDLDEYSDKVKSRCGPCVWEYRVIILVSLLGSISMIVGLGSALYRVKTDNHDMQDRLDNTTHRQTTTAVPSGSPTSAAWTKTPSGAPSRLLLPPPGLLSLGDNNNCHYFSAEYTLLSCFPLAEYWAVSANDTHPVMSTSSSSNATNTTTTTNNTKLSKVVTGASVSISQHGKVFAVGIRNAQRYFHNDSRTEEETDFATTTTTTMMDDDDELLPLAGSVHIYVYNNHRSNGKMGLDQWEHSCTLYDHALSDHKAEPDTVVFVDETFGWSVSLSGDGRRLAVASPGYHHESGRVSIYESSASSGGDWKLRTIDVTGGTSSTGDREGYSLDLSNDGSYLAIGVIGYDYDDDDRVNCGRVRVYRVITTTSSSIDDDVVVWKQVGQDLVGEQAGDRFGLSVSLSENGTDLAVGRWNDHDHNDLRASTQQQQRRGASVLVYRQQISDANNNDHDDYNNYWSNDTMSVNVREAMTAVEGYEEPGHVSVRLSSDGLTLAVSLGLTLGTEVNAPQGFWNKILWYDHDDRWWEMHDLMGTTSIGEGGSDYHDSDYLSELFLEARIESRSKEVPRVDVAMSGAGNRVFFLVDGVVRDFRSIRGDWTHVHDTTTEDYRRPPQSYRDDVSSRSDNFKFLPGAASLSRDGTYLTVVVIGVNRNTGEQRVVPYLYNVTRESSMTFIL